MFKRFKNSPYAKAALTIIVCGALLIIFNNWISNRQISVGFKTVNRTLAPVYIGVVFAFILCPVYNTCVKFLYARMVESAGHRGFSIGTTIVHDDGGSFTVSKEEKNSILTTARAIASVICVLLVVGIVALFIYFVVPQMVSSIMSFVNTLPQRLTSFSYWCRVHLKHFPMVSVWIDNIVKAGDNDVLQWIRAHVFNGDTASIATMVSNGVVAAFKYVANAFIGLLIMVYLLNYKERLFAITRKIVNATCGQKRKASLYEFASIVNETFIGFIVGRIIDSFIIGVLSFIILKVCSIPFALMISVIVGVTNVIPFFGPFIGAIPSVIILLLEDPIDALYFIVIIIVIQQLDGNVIGPRVVGNVIGISSFWVLVSVLVGGGLFGFAGMALGVPVFAVIYRYVDKLIIASLKRKEKNTHTSYYYSLEPFGIDDDEVELEPEKKKQQSLFSKLRKSNKDISQHKFAFDRNDHESAVHRDEIKRMTEEDKDIETHD